MLRLSQAARRVLGRVGVVLVLLGIVVALLWQPLLGVKTVSVRTDRVVSVTGVFPHRWLEEALVPIVRDGRVDYRALVRNPEPLRRYVSALARVGPRTKPALFPSTEHRLAYYLNAYNALVLWGIVAHWPVETVHDIDGLIEPVQGFGFFWGLRFVLDGRLTNLYDLEHDVIRDRFGDARIHAALNCASVSCPALRPAVHTPEGLDQQLDAAARRMIARVRHVRIDHDRRIVTLSKIFAWFAVDFEADARQRRAGKTVLDWIRHFAVGAQAEALDRARAHSYALQYVPYDWRLNSVAEAHD